MKTKFSNSQLAHVWAQQNQAEGSGSNFFFDGPTIYSYGRHFPIARFVTHKGKRAVLFTTRDYSVTTQRHKSRARQALPAGLLCFEVPDVNARHPDVRASYKARVARIG